MVGWPLHQNKGLLHVPIEHWAIGELIDLLTAPILETKKLVEKLAEENQEMGKDYASEGIRELPVYRNDKFS